MTKADVKNQFLNSDEEEIETVNYNTKLDEVCRGLINNNWNSYLNINKNKRDVKIRHKFLNVTFILFTFKI